MAEDGLLESHTLRYAILSRDALCLTDSSSLVRVLRIELRPLTWKERSLPLAYTRTYGGEYRFCPDVCSLQKNCSTIATNSPYGTEGEVRTLNPEGTTF